MSEPRKPEALQQSCFPKLHLCQITSDRNIQVDEAEGITSVEEEVDEAGDLEAVVEDFINLHQDVNCMSEISITTFVNMTWKLCSAFTGN